MNKELTKFWRWFFRGSGGDPGYRRLVNSWFLIHIFVGATLAYLVRVDLQSAANTVLLPLAGILVGLSFAWAGNAQALMQTSEIEQLSERRAGGFSEYVYTYQTAILCILVTLVLWALAGLKLYDDLWPTAAEFKRYLVVKGILFTFSSLTVRECWHVVMAAQLMLITRRQIAKLRAQEKQDQAHQQIEQKRTRDQTSIQP
jgi:amino acid permease